MRLKRLANILYIANIFFNKSPADNLTEGFQLSIVVFSCQGR